MIAAATHSISLDNLPFDWFDVALVLVLGFGIFRGRKNGMTKEFVPLIEWIVIVLGAAFGYALLGQLLINYGIGQSKSCAPYVYGYIAIAALIMIVFTFFRAPLKKKMEGSTMFGSSEYYLGMLSGMVRYGCIALFFLALLNAPVYTDAEIKAHDAYVARWYGGGLYKGDYFPTLQQLQASVFEKSFSGPYIRQGIPFLLVNSTPDRPATPTAQR